IYQVIIPPSTNTGYVLPGALGTVEMLFHPIMKNVHSFSKGIIYRSTSTTLAPGAYYVASWNDNPGIPLIAAREGVGMNHVRRADLNFSPVSNSVPSGTFYWDHTTDGATIMANALTWVAILAYDFSADVITNPVNQSIKS